MTAAIVTYFPGMSMMVNAIARCELKTNMSGFVDHGVVKSTRACQNQGILLVSQRRQSTFHFTRDKTLSDIEFDQFKILLQ
jgi:hypothetical protein